jgi:hypothetical protein
MTNFSPSARVGATRRTARWQRRTTGLCVAGAGAALMGLVMTPLAHADVDGSSLLLAAATDLPDGAAATGYGDLSNLYVDVSVFENSFGSYEDEVFFSDLASVGNILRASGLDVGNPFPAGATASDDVSAIAAEDTTVSGELTSLEADINDDDTTPGLAAVDSKELAVVADAQTFEQQISADVGNLPTITAQDETNPVLISELSALYNNEINLSGNLTNLGDELVPGSPAGITADNAGILSDALGILSDVQRTADTLTVLADLSSVGL